MGPRARKAKTMNATDAIASIAQILARGEWGAEFIEEVAEVVAQTGAIIDCPECGFWRTATYCGNCETPPQGWPEP